MNTTAVMKHTIQKRKKSQRNIINTAIKFSSGLDKLNVGL